MDREARNQVHRNARGRDGELWPEEDPCQDFKSWRDQRHALRSDGCRKTHWHRSRASCMRAVRLSLRASKRRTKYVMDVEMCSWMCMQDKIEHRQPQKCEANLSPQKVGSVQKQRTGPPIPPSHLFDLESTSTVCVSERAQQAKSDCQPIKVHSMILS